MVPDLDRIDAVLQYSLLTAGENDDRFERCLGPIHLIKYVYLADLVHAARNNGETFTGVQWQFYKFGPWAQIVYERIEPALRALGAESEIFPSDYEDREDWVRWSLEDPEKLEQVGKRLPLGIRGRVRRDIKNFGNDTSSLLDYVYSTAPMTAAAPNEYLKFSAEKNTGEVTKSSLRYEALSNKGKKRLRERISTISTRARHGGSPAANLVDPVCSPRFDDVFEDGVAWLDGLSGAPFPVGEQVAEISDEVWKSSCRKDGDVSG